MFAATGTTRFLPVSFCSKYHCNCNYNYNYNYKLQ